jgi:ribosomal protein S18 acetylase RimI-like enzyme
MKSSDGLQIDVLRDDEAEAAVALWEAVQITRPWNDPRSDIRLALTSTASTLLAGRLKGDLVATVMVGYDGHRGWVYYLAVALAQQGQGLGQKMMREAETWLTKRGAPKLNLMVRADNHAVQHFYEKIGYKVSDVTVLQRELS